MNHTHEPDEPSHGSADEPWRKALRRYIHALSSDEADGLRAGALRSLDRATRMRSLSMPEVAPLHALADYIEPRGERRMGNEPPSFAEGVFMGLLAGYQLGVGEQTPAAPDPFDD